MFNGILAEGYGYVNRTIRIAMDLRWRDGPLIGTMHRYELGRMPGSWFLDEAQALLVEH